jgi:cellulose synthase operon protein YhjQ
MTDNNPLTDPNGTPEDVATLYSWANLHGAKYRDFSAARAQTREKARLRAEQAAAEKAAEEMAAAAEIDPAQREQALREQIQLERAQFEQNQLERAQLEQSQLEQDRIAAEAAESARVAEAAQAAEAERAAQQAHADELARQAEWEAATARLAEIEAQAAREQAEWERHLAARQAAEEAARREAERAAEAEQAAWHAEQKRLAELAEQHAAQQAAILAAQEAAHLEAQRMQLRAAELASQQAAQKAAEVAAEQAAQQAAQQAAEQAAQKAAEQAAQRAAEQAAEQLARQRAWQQAAVERAAQVPPPAAPFYPSAPAHRPAQPPFAPLREETSRNPWAAHEAQEPAGRPAWLSNDEPETPVPPAYAAPTPEYTSPTPPPAFTQPASALPQAPEDTLQGSRDRLVSRWFALRGVFDGVPPAPEAVPPPVTSRAPSMAVFSLAGGVGKTSLVATLGRALSARGERVLLVDTAAFGLLPFFFGATDQRPGQLRTFNPPGVSADAPIQMITIDPEGMNAEPGSQESLSGEIAKFARGASRIIIDLATASGATTRRILHMSPLVLIPVIADMNSVVSVSSIDAFFEHNSAAAGKPSLPYYVLNQFDATLPLHLDVREVLREQLGERLLPFALRRTPAMSEALAEGMTVMDYAPASALADDFTTLAGWVKSLSAPATTSYRGVRWSER